MPNVRPKPEPLSLDRPVLFLHIAKTAGTSIVHFFRQRLAVNAVCSHGDFLQYPAGRIQFRDRLLEHRFISGHFGYRHVAELVDDCYSFTFLRDPVERVLSFYNFCQHADMQQRFPVARAARELGLEGFVSSRLPEVSEVVDNQQLWQLACMYWREDRRVLARLPEQDLLAMAIEHLTTFDHIGLTDSFDHDFHHILTDLAIDEPVPLKRQFASHKPLVNTALTPSALEQLLERLQPEYQLIAAARHLRQEHDRG